MKVSRLFPTSVLTASGSRVCLSNGFDGLKSQKQSTPTSLSGITLLLISTANGYCVIIDDLRVVMQGFE
ncbi:MAG: hypothetical protein ACTH7L_02545 [Psychrobacter alimentarius]